MLENPRTAMLQGRKAISFERISFINKIIWFQHRIIAGLCRFAKAKTEQCQDMFSRFRNAMEITIDELIAATLSQNAAVVRRPSFLGNSSEHAGMFFFFFLMSFDSPPKRWDTGRQSRIKTATRTVSDQEIVF